MDRLDRMLIFRRVVEAGSLSAVARARGVSLPTVSRALSTLEEQLEVELIRRSTRRMALTEAGQRYYDHCVRLADELERGEAAVRAGAKAGSLVISAPVTLGMLRVAPVVDALLAAEPQLRVDLLLEERFADFVADGVDLAIRAGGPATGSSSFIARKLGRSPRVLVASPSYLRERGKPRMPAALREHDALVTLSSSGPQHLWRLWRGEREYTVGVRGRLRSTTLLALREAARAGRGVALLPRWLVAEDLDAGRLETLLQAYAPSPIELFAVYRARERGSPIIDAFVRRLRRALSSRG